MIYVTGSESEGRTAVATMIARARGFDYHELKSDVRELKEIPLESVIDIAENFGGDISIRPGDVVLEVRRAQRLSSIQGVGHMSTQFVIYSEELGIYLGHCMGLGFWSKLDPVGQPCAVTFSTIYEARRHVASWNSLVDDVQYIQVQPDDPSKCQGQSNYASIAACVAAGLPAWDPEGDKERASA